MSTNGVALQLRTLTSGTGIAWGIIALIAAGVMTWLHQRERMRLQHMEVNAISTNKY